MSNREDNPTTQYLNCGSIYPNRKENRPSMDPDFVETLVDMFFLENVD